MNINIERTLFWFKNDNEDLLVLNDRYFPLATLLNRLLNENYRGKKIKFINLDFSTEATYLSYPQLPKDTAYYYGSHLRYYGVFDLIAFFNLNEVEQDRFVWVKACEYLKKAAKSIKNDSLIDAAEYAYKKGMEMDLNPDYRMVQANVIIYGQPMNASVWVNFRKDGMYSKLSLEKDDAIIFEKEIDKTKNGVEFFLEMYKNLHVEDNTIVINGHRDVDYFPLRIPVPNEVIR